MKFYKKCEAWGLWKKDKICYVHVLKKEKNKEEKKKKKKKKIWLQPGSNRERPHGSPM